MTVRAENQALVSQNAKLQAEVAVLEQERNRYRIERDAAVFKNADLKAQTLEVRMMYRIGCPSVSLKG